MSASGVKATWRVMSRSSLLENGTGWFTPKSPCWNQFSGKRHGDPPRRIRICRKEEAKSSELGDRGPNAGQLLMGACCARGVGGLHATTEFPDFPHPLSVWKTKVKPKKMVAFRIRRVREGEHIGPIGRNCLYLRPSAELNFEGNSLVED